MTKQREIKKRNLALHLVLTAKRTSGSSGQHQSLKSKDKRRKIEKQLDRKQFNE